MTVVEFIHASAVFSCLVVVVSCDGHFENVAVNKNCTMNEKWNNVPERSAGDAVNNNTDGHYETESGNYNCIHTKSEYRSYPHRSYISWWEVDLGRLYPVRDITIWARTGFERRMRDCVITVDGTECYRFHHEPARREISLSCYGVVNGRVVRVTKESHGSDGDDTINICEFQVFSCSEDYWGSGCDRQCGHCSEGEVCDKVTGHCSSCSQGWRTPLCDQECKNGTFGDSCSQNCSAGCVDVCDNVSGNCTCKPGWQGHICDRECSQGTYGLHCAQNCSVHCEDACHRSTGFCNCTKGYLPPNCTQECRDGAYGSDCHQPCSEGCDDACDKVTGECTCKPGWQGPTCDTEVMSSATGTDDSPDTGIIAGAAGGGVVAVVAAVGVVVGIVIVRRRRSQAKGAAREDNTQRNQGVSMDHSGDSIYHTIDPPDTTKAPSKPAARVPPAKKSKPKRTSDRPPSSNTKSVSYTNVAFNGQGHDPDTALYLNVDPRSTERSRSTTSQYLDEPEVEEEEEVELQERRRGEDEISHRDVYYNDDVYMTSEATDGELDVTQRYLLDKLRGSDLDQEFKDLPEGLINDHRTGADRENYYRNRFTSILPYEENRVVLQGTPDRGSNDYINASYIPGRQSSKQYIAAQAPRPNTVGDFWKMIWQEKVTTIVMLTNLKEGKKKKCALYWPSPGEHAKYASVDVTGREVRQKANYIVRTFDVKVGNEASRHVTQYHYTTWPDHGVPTTKALVDLWKTVKHGYGDQQHPSPLLVHCSAGVGRTGTYIALDTVMDRLQHQTQPAADLDVYQVVKDLRNSRCYMVQAKSQYVVLHEALLEAYSSQGCRLPLLTFDSYFRHPVDPQHRNTRIDTQFLKLKQMKVLLHKPSHTQAEREDNINKNRNLDVLPDDRHLIRSMEPVDGRNDYINAVRVETLDGPRGSILTQLPLADTMVDLWRLVIGSDVSLIVSLGSDADESERKYCYWPRQKNQQQTFGPINVRLTSLSSPGKHLVQYILSVRREGVLEARHVTLLHYGGWKGELPDSSQEFGQLLDCVRTTKPPTGSSNSPILLQCKNGATKSGLFSVICDVIGQMTTERMVDAYMAVRNVHMVRPECMTSKVQYRYIFTTVQEFRNRNDIYHNA